MKNKFKLITVVASVFLFAATSQVKATEEPTEASCEDIADNVALIMELRQKGVSLDKVYNVYNDNKVWQEVVLHAYEVPRYMLERNQQKEILRFKNEALLVCYKNQ
jgi:hypothetical protein